jgi:hypothetical protein
MRSRVGWPGTRAVVSSHQVRPTTILTGRFRYVDRCLTGRIGDGLESVVGSSQEFPQGGVRTRRYPWVCHVVMDLRSAVLR